MIIIPADFVIFDIKTSSSNVLSCSYFHCFILNPCAYSMKITINQNISIQKYHSTWKNNKGRKASHYIAISTQPHFINFPADTYSVFMLWYTICLYYLFIALHISSAPCLIQWRCFKCYQFVCRGTKMMHCQFLQFCPYLKMVWATHPAPPVSGEGYAPALGNIDVYHFLSSASWCRSTLTGPSVCHVYIFALLGQTLYDVIVIEKY